MALFAGRLAAHEKPAGRRQTPTHRTHSIVTGPPGITISLTGEGFDLIAARAAWVCSLYALIPLGVAYLVFLRRDVTED